MAPATLLTYLLATLSLAQARPHLFGRQLSIPSEACTNEAVIPDLWSVRDLQVSYGFTSSTPSSTPGGNATVTRIPSTASFTLTNTQTNTTDALKCNLRSNFMCVIAGTPGDSNVHVWLQLNLHAYFTIAHLQVGCEGNVNTGRAVSVIALVDMEMECDGDGDGGEHIVEVGNGPVTCKGGRERPSFATGMLTVDAPAPTPSRFNEVP